MTSLLAVTRIHWAPDPGALAALLGTLDESGRYPMNATITDTEVTKAIASNVGTDPANIVLGAGSGEILRSTVRAFNLAEPTSGDRRTLLRLSGQHRPADGNRGRCDSRSTRS